MMAMNAATGDNDISLSDTENGALPKSGDEIVNAPDTQATADLYTVFSTGERRFIMALVGFAMLFSPLTANIYFPAMSDLKHALNASQQEIDLTITSYLIFQAIGPAIFGDIADALGRRLAFVVMLAVYSIANVGLALQTSLPALLTLRMLQSLGCSASIAVSYGVITDIATPADRGGMIGTAMIATNLGPALAPAIGGGILIRGGWRWIFWFLLICGVLMLVLVLAALPETARRLVGNGAVVPGACRQTLLFVLFGFRIPKMGRLPPSRSATDIQHRQWRLPNPLRSLRMLLYRDAIPVLLISGVFYMIYYCIQASIATLFQQIYQFDTGVIGACYVSIGSGVAVGGYLNGRLMNWNYKCVAEGMGLEIDRQRGDDLKKFPIEKARLRFMTYLHFAHLIVLAGYGWMMQKQVVSPPWHSHCAATTASTNVYPCHSMLAVRSYSNSPSASWKPFWFK
jgi:MFS family permease